MSTSTNEYSHLTELDKSKYEVAEGESDVRSWVVKNENGNILGEVKDLIFDSRLRKVVFIVLDMDRNELNLKERTVLIPIEYADINEAYKNVVVRGLMPNELATLPTYEKGKITRNSIDLTMSTFISSQNTNVSTGTATAGNTSQPQYFSETARQPGEPVSRDTDASTGQRSQAETIYTVVGVFDHARPTQAAIEYLLEHGFGRQEITVSTQQTEVMHEQRNRDESGISSFFRNLFGNDDEARRYSDATEHGSVITVDVPSRDRAEEAARILDQHGSLDMSGSQENNTSGNTKAGNTRIFERRSRN
jgi:hypothetical protein